MVTESAPPIMSKTINGSNPAGPCSEQRDEAEGRGMDALQIDLTEHRIKLNGQRNARLQSLENTNEGVERHVPGIFFQP